MPIGSIALGPVGLFGGTDLFLIAIAVYDWRSRGRIHPATLWGGAFLIVFLALSQETVRCFRIARQAGWCEFRMVIEERGMHHRRGKPFRVT